MIGRLAHYLIKYEAEFLLALYLYIFSLLKILTVKNADLGYLVLAAVAMTFLGISAIQILFGKKRSVLFSISRLAALVSLVIIVFSFDVVFRYNSEQIKYLYSFFIYGIIPIVLLSRVTNLEAFFRCFSVLGFATLALYIFEPINGYPYFENYMSYGFGVALPAAIGLYIGRKVYHIRWLLPAELTAYVYVLLFANRSSTLVLLLFLSTMLFVEAKSRMRTLRIGLLCVIAVILIVNAGGLIAMLNETLVDKGIASYSVSSINFTNVSGGDATSGREAIWGAARKAVSENILFGHGTGYFESLTGIYTHNIFLESLVSHGILGIIVVGLIVITALSGCVRRRGKERLFAIFAATLGLVPLLFSMQIFTWPYFWILLANIFARRNVVHEG